MDKVSRRKVIRSLDNPDARTFFAQCGSKVKFKSAAEAEETKQRFGQAQVYQCPWCNLWHITSKQGGADRSNRANVERCMEQIVPHTTFPSGEEATLWKSLTAWRDVMVRKWGVSRDQAVIAHYGDCMGYPFEVSNLAGRHLTVTKREDARCW